MNIEIAGAAWVLPLAFILLAISSLLIMLRLWRGPSQADRVVAIDALTLLGVAAVTLLALLTAQTSLLDAAVMLALVSFLGTTAFMLLFTTDKRKPEAEDQA
jgi:multicomponent Na+:H+ antiporter subunit F